MVSPVSYKDYTYWVKEKRKLPHTFFYSKVYLIFDILKVKVWCDDRMLKTSITKVIFVVKLIRLAAEVQNYRDIYANLIFSIQSSSAFGNIRVIGVTLEISLCSWPTGFESSFLSLKE